MTETFTTEPAARLPLPPKNPLPYWQRLKAVRDFGAGLERLRDAGGPITRIDLGAKWGCRRWWLSRHHSGPTTYGRTDAFVRTRANQQWLPRRRPLQPIFHFSCFQ